ncbi:hypothetical protein Q5P01_000655 [Channa striata]|uniref:Uncharacterized protein n=1 Tax=Channa striata TaxID=64152 RepID=A0AA88IX74_CHASR|nr:hypothetical protein Q5P01_000655 [Channa striata]
MCHDPSMAERFYVALPDKERNYEIRKLRMKALKMAAAKPYQEDEISIDEEDASLDETPDTSSDSEEPVYDDRPESDSSPSSEEFRSWKKNETPAQQMAETLMEENLGCVPETAIQYTVNSVLETSAKQMLETSAEESPRCLHEPIIQHPLESVSETPAEND